MTGSTPGGSLREGDTVRIAARRGALILAAGASQRMGTPKALLPWGNATLLDYVLAQARAALADVIVVALGPATRHLTASLGDVRVTVNPLPESGRSASIRIGSAALAEDVRSIVIQSVDQPCPVEVLTALFDAIEADPAADIAVPSYQGRRGHPVCFAGRLLHKLRSVTEAGEGLRAVVRAHAAHLVEVPVQAESVLWNLNDPAAYAAAQLNTK
jgi:molybdenum cofactor cytidylyltransferase